MAELCIKGYHYIKPGNELHLEGLNSDWLIESNELYLVYDTEENIWKISDNGEPNQLTVSLVKSNNETPANTIVLENLSNNTDISGPFRLHLMGIHNIMCQVLP